MKMIRLFARFAGFCFAMVLATNVYAGQTEQISQQDYLQAVKSDASDVVLLDVRSAQEFEQGHIAGAINISHTDIEAKLNELAPFKDKTIVVYCRSGRRAGIAEDILAKNGFNKLRHLTGDMNGWLAADLPVNTVK